MPIIATEDFRGRKLSYCAPWVANKRIHVSGVTREEDALNNCGFKINDSWSPAFATLKCKGPVVAEKPGPFYWIIDAPFEQPPGGVFLDPTLDPLNQPSRISWFSCELSVPVDYDLDGRPICNAVGDPFSPPSRRVTYKRFRAIRNEPYYDVMKSDTFENTVNQAAMTILGYSVDVQHMRCCIITPGVQDYLQAAEYLPIVYEFEIIFGNALGKYPFQHRFFNQGVQGWGGDGTETGVSIYGFCDVNKNPIGKEIPLDLTGKPFGDDYASIRVGNEDKTAPIARPTPTQFYDSDQLTVNKKAVGYAVYYKETGLANHLLLAL